MELQMRLWQDLPGIPVGRGEVLMACRTEQQVHEHCPNDIVVWADPQNGGYHLRGL
jgi:hypothetical protein